MVQLGVLTTEFERHDLAGNLDAVARHNIGAVQFQLGSALPEIPLRTSLEMGLDALGPHLSAGLCLQIRDQLSARGIAPGRGGRYLQHGGTGRGPAPGQPRLPPATDRTVRAPRHIGGDIVHREPGGDHVAAPP